ncbi:MAG: 4-hydroxy-tetrahydrodipicolinate reductase, partial [Bdellovibrionota bacterium]
MKTVLLNGAFGRMGAELQKIITQQKNKIVTVDPKGRGDFKSFKEIKKQKIDAVIDFSSEEGMGAALDWCVQTQTPFVSGTTGISEKAQAALKKASAKTAVLWAPNMSLGIHV